MGHEKLNERGGLFERLCAKLAAGAMKGGLAGAILKIGVRSQAKKNSGLAQIEGGAGQVQGRCSLQKSLGSVGRRGKWAIDHGRSLRNRAKLSRKVEGGLGLLFRQQVPMSLAGR